MATSIVDIRNAIFNGLLMKKTAEGFILNDWDIEQSYLPQTSISELAVNGPMIWVLCGTFDTINPRDKGNLAERITMVHMGIQYKLLASQVDKQDDCVRLQEEIRDEIRLRIVLDIGGNVHWKEDTCLKDPNKLPYSYKAQREANVFEQYFTVHFSEFVKE